MANRDEILRELIVEEIRCAIENGTINIKDLLRYDQDFVFSNPRDIPSLGYVESLIGTGGGAIIYRTFIIPSSDITNGSVNLTGRTNEQGDFIIPIDAAVSIYEGGKIVPATYYENGLIEGLDGSLDVKVVLIGGEAIPIPLLLSYGHYVSDGLVVRFILNKNGIEIINTTNESFGDIPIIPEDDIEILITCEAITDTGHTMGVSVIKNNTEIIFNEEKPLTVGQLISHSFSISYESNYYIESNLPS